MIDKAEREYRFKIKHGKVHIKKYLGKASKVVIPEFIEDMPVTKIDWWAFQQNDNMTEVVIPRTVKYIEYGAFGLCRNLKKVTFTAKVYLNGAAFVSSGVEEVEGQEFITGDVSGRNFFDCTPFMEKTDIMIFDDKLIRCRTDEEVYRVPSNIKAIGYGAFTGPSLKEVILPDGLKEIYNWAFMRTKIASFRIPDSVEVLGGSSLTTDAPAAPIEDWYIPEDFGRRYGWNFDEFSDKVNVIHDTQFCVKPGRPRSTDERVYEDVSCNACGYNMFLTPVAKQTFPKGMKYLKHVSLLAAARVNVLKTDDFKIGGCENVFRVYQGYLHPRHNTPRRFRIIFDLEGSYGEILFYLPYLPWIRGHKPDKICDFYNSCLNIGKDGRFFDMQLYDDNILKQDIPLKVKREIAVLRCNGNYRLSDKAEENYRKFLERHNFAL